MQLTLSGTSKSPSIYQIFVLTVVAGVSPKRLTYSGHIAVPLGQGGAQALGMGPVMGKTESFVGLASGSSQESMEVECIPDCVACEGVRLHAGC